MKLGQISYFFSDFSSRGGTRCSLADIVVATPGRLVDHINKGSGLCLEHLRFLVSSVKLSNWNRYQSTAVITDLCHAFSLSSRSLMRLTGWLTACTSCGSVRWSGQCTGQEVDQRLGPSSGAQNRHMSQQPGENSISGGSSTMKLFYYGNVLGNSPICHLRKIRRTELESGC